ncbi:MAG: hypothetical protein RBU21_13780 [FCB group bacterium]|jgi:hypothetical protein|nr:hypothetical protein [FCB group bacterium]
MADYLVRCTCGAETPVSEWAIGAPLRCKTCNRPLEITDKNARLAPDDQPRRPRESDMPISPEGRMHTRREQTKPSPSPRSVAPAPPPVAKTPFVPSMPEAPPPPPAATNCARCGRVFRGDWDRYRRAEGTLCHVCANLATAKPEEEPEPEPVTPSPPYGGIEYKGVLDHPVLPREDDDTPADLAARQARIRQWVLVAAVVTLVLIAIVIATDDTPIPEPDMSQTGEPVPDLPPWATVAVVLTMFVFRSLGLGLALYLILHWKDRLPSDFLPANIVTLGIWALGLELLQLGMSVVPLGGFLWIGVCMYILWDQFDLGFTDFLMLAVFLVLLQPLVMVLRAFALAAIGAVAL